MRSNLKYLSSFSLIIVLIATAANRLVAQPLQREIPYFVDAVGPEYDLAQEAKESGVIRRLPRSEQVRRVARNDLRRPNWRAYLRSDGTWTPDIFNSGDYWDRQYPVEFVLPHGYRGAFEVASDVAGAPPLQIVNDKIEIDIPASGIYETSSPDGFLLGNINQGTSQGKTQFFFEMDGKRTAITTWPQKAQVLIFFGSDKCRPMYQSCLAYFVGSEGEWDAAKSVACAAAPEEGQLVILGGHCLEVPPGSTQPVSDIVPAQGKPLVVSSQFYGRTLNGRRVVLSTEPVGRGSWQYDGPEPSVPDEPALAAELRKHVKTALRTNAGTLEYAQCTPDKLRAILLMSIAGPYRFYRAAYSSTITADFVAASKSKEGTVYSGLRFSRGQQGWRLVNADCDNYSNLRYELVSMSNTQLSAFDGRANIEDFAPGFNWIVLRQDGTWESDEHASSESLPQQEESFTGYDMNGRETAFTVNRQSGRTWRRVNNAALPIRAESVLSDLNHSLDRYIQLISAGKLDEFAAEWGEKDPYEAYKGLDADKSGDDCTKDLCNLFKETDYGKALLKKYGESHFKEALKNFFLERANRGIELLLETMKQVRNETPRITLCKPFEPTFAARYTLASQGPGQSKTVVRMWGQGSKWAFESIGDAEDAEKTYLCDGR
jgi:hypothetical protein